MIEFLILILGVLYGLLIGIIPTIGPSTGMILLTTIVYFFLPFPYLGVIFCTAAVAATATGDTFSSILLGIPGSSSSSATVVDGYPLAKKGMATYALSAAFTSSTISGLFYGAIIFFSFPYLGEILHWFGTVEILCLQVLSFVSVCFMLTKNWGKAVCSLLFGILLGLVGVDVNYDPRFTLDWLYLESGIPLLIFISGIFAVPEIIEGFIVNRKVISVTPTYKQTFDGIKIAFKNIKLSLQGGFIGAVIGALPGLSGTIAEWMAYARTVQSNKKESFGNGNIKGVIGPEGSNNATTAASFIPTILFGIPGTPFAAIIILLFTLLNFDIGSLELLEDQLFFTSLTIGFIGGTILTWLLCILLSKYMAYLLYIPFRIYSFVLLLVISYASMQYTRGWEDILLLIILSCIGLICKRFKFSRPALLIGFILSGKIEASLYQVFGLYSIESLLTNPSIILTLILALVIVIVNIRNKNKIEFT